MRACPTSSLSSCSVGGIIGSTNKLALAMPFIGLAAVLSTVTLLSAVYLRRVKGKKKYSD
jgi:hypothetical protein